MVLKGGSFTAVGAISILLSTTNLVSMITPGLFSGVVFAQHGREFCGHREQVAIWQEVMKHSAAWKTIATGVDLQMYDVVMWLWFFQFLPYLFVLYFIFPGWGQVDGTGINRATGEPWNVRLCASVTNTIRFVCYSCFARTLVFLANPYQQLAECCGIVL